MQKRITYEWALWTPRRGESIPTESDRLPAEVFPDCDLYARLTRTGCFNIDLSIHKTNSSPITVDINLKVSSYPEEFNKSAYEWRDSCKLGNLLNHDVRIVSITCVITWQIPEVPAMETPPPRPLAFPAENYLMSLTLSDVTIVIGKEELPAHKLILCGCSSVFCQMLSTPMKEAQTSRITIEDTDVDTMKKVLTFLYKGKCEALSKLSVACKVLVAAHKYDIPQLQENCVRSLFKHVNAQNVVQILELADLYGKEQLRKVCWKFIMQNKAGIIVAAEFQDLCRRNGGVMGQFMVEVVKACP